MVKIVIENLGGKEVISNDRPQSALTIMLGHYTDWMHACGGKGRCTTCKMIVIKGSENLGEMTPSELAYFRQGALLKQERLACQALVYGDIVIRVPEEGKFPHLTYDL